MLKAAVAASGGCGSRIHCDSTVATPSTVRHQALYQAYIPITSAPQTQQIHVRGTMLGVATVCATDVGGAGGPWKLPLSVKSYGSLNI